MRIAEDGWGQSPVVQAARAALGYAGNPADVHSGLLLRTLGPDPLPLQAALAAQIDGRLADDPVLMRLAALSDRLLRLPVSAALDLVLEAAGLRPWAEAQPDAAQARADLLRLEAEALDFEAAHRDLKAASGFHGETAKVFLGWLDARADERDFDRRPDPSADSTEAVEIVTWHASKGREWPITVVAEFDAGIEEWPGATSVTFDALDRIGDMGAVMASARLIHTPALAAPEAQARFIEDRRPEFEANARNLLYVALTRARDRLVLEWPGFLKGEEEDAPQARNLFHVFEDCCHPKIGADMLRIGDVSCPARARAMPEIAGLTGWQSAVAGGFLRLGKDRPLPPVPLSPWRVQPSGLNGTGAVAPPARAVDLGAALSGTGSSAERGTALHLALRTFMARPDLADRLPAATGLDAATLALVGTRAAALKGWLAEQGFDRLAFEVPLLGRRAEGAEIPGSIDLLAEGPQGLLIVDHKTGGSGMGLGPHWPQLAAYMGLVAEAFPGKPVLGAAIHWVDHGRLEVADAALPSEALTQIGTT